MDPEQQQAERNLIAIEVRRFRQGDAGAAEALSRRALRLSLRTATALLWSREEASDTAQDVAVDVLRSLHKLRDPEAFDAWVHRITVRHALRRLKRRRRAREAEAPLALLAEEDHPAAVGHADVDSVLAARQGLVAALSKLSPKQRLALALHYVHDLSDAEIAAALGCRTGTVHALLSRGRSALRADTQLLELALDLKGG
jgi:RNA polymerase sigma factor (sigma-70 family)